MRPGLRSMRWIPPFLVGVSTATSAEIAVGLLLYSGPGMLRSLTTVLVIESAALGLGLWSAPGPGPRLGDSLRRRWLLYLGSIAAATAFAAAWSLIGRLGSTGAQQGAGLAFLAGLPLYACGALLGAMSSASASQAPRRPAEVEAPAVAGAAVGFAATGLSLAHVLTPASLLLTALALVAAAGLVHGAILDTAAPPPHVEAFGGEASEPESALEERGEPEAGP